jgi:hypothetical protein
MLHIAVINKSKLVTPSDVATMTMACHIQLQHDAAPLWGSLPVPVTFYQDDAHAPQDVSPIYIFDTADEAGALGYHTEDSKGRVYGKVFAKDLLAQGAKALTGADSIASVLSHEVLELWGDPNVNRWAEAPNGRLYAIELCDPVEADWYNITVGTNVVSVSNFILPAWFDDSPPKGAKVDFMGRIHAPFSMSKGGYVAYRSGGVEHQTFARKLTLEYGEAYPEWRKPGKGHAAARTNRRSKK